MATVDSGTSATSRAYVSIYAAFRLARILLNVKERLKSRIKSRSPAAKASTAYRPDNFRDNEHEEITRVLNIRSRSGTLVHPQWRRKQAQGGELELSELIQKLDSSIDDKLSSIATQDRRFLEYDSQRAATINDASVLRRILDLITLLLDRLEAFPGTYATNHRKIHLTDCDYLKCEKFIANLEHLLRCLQQAVVEALIYNALKLIDADCLRWHQNWQLRRGHRDGWFAEWPNGQPPLNTTWPWNDVKPSLVVLWGVCWMFYGDNHALDQNRGWVTTPEPFRQSGGQRDNHPVRTGHRPLGAASATISQDQITLRPWSGQNTDSWSEEVGGNRDIGSNSASVSDSYAPSSDAWSLDLSTACALSESSHQFSLLPEDYYLLDDDLLGAFPASSNTLDPYMPGTRTPDTPYGPWPCSFDQQDHQQQHDPPHTLTTRPQPHSTDGLLVSELSQQKQKQPPNPLLQYHQQQQQQHQIQSLYKHQPPLENITPQLEATPPDRTAHLPSSHSDVSNLGPTSCISGVPVSPTFQADPTSSSPGESPLSGREGRARSMEPRNEEGLLYCTHQDCLNESRIFPRKCEYQKHMDKHNRPYVCEEPGCEKIRGFTYSGGLLRHQREVHRQHGGPKASCMCPFRDCKRSTGTGFSRKENLSEHLRRVHRGVGDERDTVVTAPTALASSTPTGRSVPVIDSRKRRRANDDDDNDDDDDMDAVNEPRDLRKQVRRLRKELQEKDERLKKLEQAVGRLTGGRLPASSA
ncbi:hypothetical protein MMC07_001264 [Pseudocyphellaria aurata]|nr:hypothetical protein [Pseudocyphellaria aurata]